MLLNTSYAISATLGSRLKENIIISIARIKQMGFIHIVLAVQLVEPKKAS